MPDIDGITSGAEADFLSSAHDSLLGELESIRTLLAHDEDNIPLLLPESDGYDFDEIPTLLMTDAIWQDDVVPLLEDVVVLPEIFSFANTACQKNEDYEQAMEVIIESVINELMPKMETMLRNLLQDKLQSEKRLQVFAEA